MPPASELPDLPHLLERIHDQLLPHLLIRSAHPHDPVQVQNLPSTWLTLGCGNYAAVLHHHRHPELVVMV
jgi:hypothetical protein